MGSQNEIEFIRLWKKKQRKTRWILMNAVINVSISTKFGEIYIYPGNQQIQLLEKNHIAWL